jgi:hypothetical protein
MVLGERHHERCRLVDEVEDEASSPAALGRRDTAITHSIHGRAARPSAWGATVTGMAAEPDKVTVELDAQIVERTRSELGAGTQSDAAIVERALNAYLLGRLLDTTQAKSGLSDDEAADLAYDELRAARRELGAA